MFRKACLFLVLLGIILLMGCSQHKETSSLGAGARLTYETRVTFEISYEQMAYLRDLILEGKGLAELVAAVVGIFK